MCIVVLCHFASTLHARVFGSTTRRAAAAQNDLQVIACTRYLNNQTAMSMLPARLEQASRDANEAAATAGDSAAASQQTARALRAVADAREESLIEKGALIIKLRARVMQQGEDLKVCGLVDHMQSGSGVAVCPLFLFLGSFLELQKVQQMGAVLAQPRLNNRSGES